MILPKNIGIAMNMLRRLHYNVHLAGGAVRDTLLGRPVKDWDIFIPCSISVEQVEKAIGVKGEDFLCQDEYVNWSAGTIHCSGNFHFPDGTLANVIWLKPEIDSICVNVERFDWGICKVGLDRDGNLYYGNGWQEDVDDKMFRLRSICAAGLEHNMKRFWRLHEKYPEFGLEIPAEYGRYIQRASFDFVIDL